MSVRPFACDSVSHRWTAAAAACGGFAAGRHAGRRHRSTAAGALRVPCSRRRRSAANQTTCPRSKLAVRPNALPSLLTLLTLVLDLEFQSPASHGHDHDLCMYTRGRGGSVAEWLARWTQAQKGQGSNRSRDNDG